MDVLGKRQMIETDAAVCLFKKSLIRGYYDVADYDEKWTGKCIAFCVQMQHTKCKMARFCSK